MKQLIIVLSAAALLGGCNDHTGQEWLDPFIVRDFEDRVELTNFLLSGATYCDFGCDYICSMRPEPLIYRNLHAQNLKKFSELDALARSSGLVLELPKRPGIIIKPMSLPELLPEEIAPTKLECIQKQRKHIKNIETLLNRLETKDR